MSGNSFERHIAFEGCFNFRDLGGYRTRDGRTVRWRRLFRSDALHRLTARDAERARAELGIVTVLDLRTRDEISRNGVGPLVADPIRYGNFPIIDDIRRYGEKRTSAERADQYLEMLAEGRFQIAAALERLADPRAYPVVFHCAAGKDRTGVLAAVILGLLGVETETIAADYALTNHSVGRVVEWMRATPEYVGIVHDLPAERFHVASQTIVTFLERLRREHGSLQAYFEACGVGRDVFTRIEAELLSR